MHGGGGWIGRIQLGDGRREHEIDAFGAAGRQITAEVARVAVEVFVGTELQRVDEDRHDDELAIGPRRRHERAVTRMQKAHGGHESDALSGTTSGIASGPEFGDGLDDDGTAGSHGG